MSGNSDCILRALTRLREHPCKGSRCWLRDAENDIEKEKEGRFARVKMSYDLSLKSSKNFLEPKKTAERLYQPISPDQTRPLIVRRDEPGKPLVCQMIVADITRNGMRLPDSGATTSYKALSYCWGEPKFDFPMICNGVAIGITSNLAFALLTVREMGETLPLWVDAVCINQHDNEERTNQVQRMFSIYEQADSIVAWMGPPTTFTYLGLALLKFIARKASRDDFVEGGWLIQPLHGPECARNLIRAATAMKDLCASPWLYRSWVRQEAFFQPNVLLHWGLQTCKLKDFTGMHNGDWLLDAYSAIESYTEFYHDELEGQVEAARQFDALSPLEYVSPSLYFLARPIGEESVGVFSAGSMWLRLLISGAAFDLTDPRDRVYAYYGMANNLIEDTVADEDDPGKLIPWLPSEPVQINYKRSVEQVYQDIAVHLLQYYAPRVLQICEAREDHPHDLPSWVPDWRSKKRRLLIEAQGSNAWPKLTPSATPHRKVHDNKLTLWGKIYGTVGAEYELGGLRGLDIMYESVEDCHKPQWFGSSGQLGNSELKPWKMIFHIGGDDRPDYRYIEDDSRLIGKAMDAYSGGVYKTVNVKIDGKEPKSWDIRRLWVWALVATAVKEGDLIVWFEGAEVEMIIRPLGGQGHFRFLGPALIRNRKRFETTARKAQIQQFTLV